MKFDYDILIVGGGPAGLSAALSAGRMSVRTGLIDDGRPRNAASSHANNVPTRDGIHPAKWREMAREDLKKYPTVELRTDSVLRVMNMSDATDAEPSSPVSVDNSATKSQNPSASQTAFTVELRSGSKLKVRKVVLAHGISDNMPAIEGFKELWGKLIYHCPFCHGYEVKNQRLALIALSPMAFHPLPLIASLSNDLVFLTNGEFKLDIEQLSELKRYGIKLEERKIKRVARSGADGLTIEFDDGQKLERGGAFATLKLPVTQKSDLGEQLGCKKTDFGFYEVNQQGETSIPGVFAAGDSATMMHSVVAASASGSLVGAMLSALTWKK